MRTEPNTPTAETRRHGEIKKTGAMNAHGCRWCWCFKEPLINENKPIRGLHHPVPPPDTGYVVPLRGLRNVVGHAPETASFFCAALPGCCVYDATRPRLAEADSEFINCHSRVAVAKVGNP